MHNARYSTSSIYSICAIILRTAIQLPENDSAPWPGSGISRFYKDLLRAVSIGTGPDATISSETEETESDNDEEELNRPLGEHQEDAVLRADKDINLDSPLITDHHTLPVTGSPSTSAPHPPLAHEPTGTGSISQVFTPIIFSLVNNTMLVNSFKP